MSIDSGNKSRGNKFVNDIGIYAIGNLGSKLVTFLLMPFYTYFISPEEYGYYDICFMVITFLMPFIMLQFRDSVFRFLVDAENDDERRQISSIACRLMSGSSLFFIIVGGIVSFFMPIKYAMLVILLAISMSFYDVAIQVVRGLGHTKTFVSTGIITSFMICLFGILFVMILDMGVPGIFYSNILARVLAIGYMELRLHVFRKYISFKLELNKNRIKSLLRYGLPLIPATLLMWVISSSNRFVIQACLGLEDNGLFSVINKFVAILETLVYIFYQAWQETALRQYSSNDRDKFFTGIFNGFAYVVASLIIVISYGLKLNYGWLVDDAYYESVQYLFLIFVAKGLNAFCMFYELGYQCTKKTAKVLPGLMAAAGVNVALNFALVNPFGIYGIIVSMIVAYAILLLYRVYDTRKMFHVSFNKNSTLSVLLLVVSCFVFQMVDNLYLSGVHLLVVVALLVLIIPENLKRFILEKTGMAKKVADS